MNMTLVEKLESELRRLEMVKSEALENEGIGHFDEFRKKPSPRGEHFDQWINAERQRLTVQEMIATAKAAEMKFEAYEKVKEV